RFLAMQAGFREMDGAGALAVTFLEGMDAVEPHAPGALAIGVEIRQGSRVAAGVPFLAGRGAGVAADTDVEIDDQPELFLSGIGTRQVGHSAASRCGCSLSWKPAP